MSTFCVDCGKPLAAGSQFCSGCGKPSPNQPVASAASAKTGGSALKIILVVVCVLAVVGISAVGGVLYLAHRVKQAVVQKAAENGVDLHSIANTASSDSSSRRKLPPVCDLLTNQQVSQLIGQPIDHSQMKDAACMYYGPAGLSARLAQEKASRLYKRAQAPGSNVDASEVATAAEQLVNNMVPQAGANGDGGELPLLALMLDADGKSQMTAVIATKGIFSGLAQSSNGKMTMGADIAGLGDKAVFMPKLGLNVLQGDTFLRIIPGPFPDSDSKTIAVARAILPKI